MENRDLMRQRSHSYDYVDKNGENKAGGVDADQTLLTVDVDGKHRHIPEYSEIWSKPNSENFTQCISRPKSHKKPDEKTSGYLLVNANCGLNQMRLGYVIWLLSQKLKATLVLPSRNHSSYWADESGFKDLFNWRYFIETLRDEIHIVESLPPVYDRIKPFTKTPISLSKGFNSTETTTGD